MQGLKLVKVKSCRDYKVLGASCWLYSSVLEVYAACLTQLLAIV